MSNFIEYKDTVAFHPGYYIKELVEESGLTQEDFAKRLDTTPKNLSVLISGNQSLSIDIAMKLSRMVGTSVDYWLNLQKNYDSLVAEFKSEEELEREKKVLKMTDYRYFVENFNLPDLPRKTDQQVEQVRAFVGVSTLTVFEEPDLAASFRSHSENLSPSNIVNANIMVQIAINKALKVTGAKYNKHKFQEAVEYVLTLTSNHSDFLPLVKKAFIEAGVILVVLPNLKNSGINGATKKVGDKVMLMVNDRNKYADTFWFSLFHEIGHIVNGDYGISFCDRKGDEEDAADVYAMNKLIPAEAYERFKKQGVISERSIREFADEIGRDPGIVFGRLQHDRIIPYADTALSEALRHRYRVKLV